MEAYVWVGCGVGEDPERDGEKKGVRDDALCVMKESAARFKRELVESIQPTRKV